MVPAIMRGLPLEFSTPVNFLVGENGSDKSTFLEALGWALGLSAQGGNRTNT
jgi:predicted ATPase